MEATPVMPGNGEGIEVPLYDLGWVRLVAARCFGCGRAVQYWNLPFGVHVFPPRCCGRWMFASSPTPFGNASLN